MHIRLAGPQDAERYDAWLHSHSQDSLWQSRAWQTYQEALGRTTRLYLAEKNDQIVGSALVIIDRTQFGLSTWEVPRGPLTTSTDAANQWMNTLVADAKKSGCVTLFVSPSVRMPRLQPSGRHVHPEATRMLDLTLKDDDLLDQMKPKGRYNIRLAEKHAVRIEESADADAYAAIAQETARRDRFRGHAASHYRTFLQQLPGSFLLLAYAPDATRPIAGLIGVTYGTTGIYYYGASSNEARPLMAPYLLQWHAMRLCRSRGCRRYDLFGIAPEGAASHPWAGVSDFKAKFGGQYIKYLPEQERIVRPMLKKALHIKRRLLG